MTDNIKINSESKLKDFIYIIDNVLQEKVCDLIIKEYKDTEWSDALISRNIKNNDVRNCKNINISDISIINHNESFRKYLDNEVFNSVGIVINEIFNKFGASTEKDSGYQLLKYEEGGFYKEHIDTSSIINNRRFSCSFNLNDDYGGGEFSFFNDEIRYKIKKGSAIIFPSNNLFPHQILPITKGTRYSIVTWIC